MAEASTIAGLLLLLANLAVLGLNLKLYTEVLKDKSQDLRTALKTAEPDSLGEAIEWETLDGLYRTTNPDTAKNWEPNVGVRVVRRAKVSGGAS